MFLENSNDVMESKLLILYVLNKIDYSLTNSEITQFILENNYMNYFMVQQFLGELVHSKFIEFSTKDGAEYYHLSKAGKDTLTFFNDRIPANLKEKIDNDYILKKSEMIKSNQIFSNYFMKSDKEYIVIIKVIENNIVLLNLSLNVSSEEQAKLISKNWKEKSSYVYKSIIDLLATESS